MIFLTQTKGGKIRLSQGVNFRLSFRIQKAGLTKSIQQHYGCNASMATVKKVPKWGTFNLTLFWEPIKLCMSSAEKR